MATLSSLLKKISTNWRPYMLASNEEKEAWKNLNNVILNSHALSSYYPININTVDPLFIEHDVDNDDPNMPNYVKKIFISEKKITPPGFLSEESILQGTANIPKLYMYVVFVDEHNTSENVPKEDIHYAYIYNFLNSRYYHIPIDRRYKFIKDFINQAKPNLDKVAKYFDTQPKKIGGGVDGIAFSIGNQRVLKIFMSDYIYKQYLKVLDRLHNKEDYAENEIMIYDVGEIGKFFNDKIYYCIMEKLHTFDDDSDEIAEAIGNIVNFIKIEIIELLTNSINKIDKDKVKNLDKSQITSFMNETYNKIINDHILNNSINDIENEYSNLNALWVKKLILEILSKVMTGRGDLHLGNLGITNQGVFKFFDPAHENWESKINL
ncbi:MAG: hypothetical protein LC122_13325 [Chitinophagales bacterium]|nr:hypothetical protein [Chitinophagales bacterium]